MRVVDAVTSISTIADVTQKVGRTGPLVFVKVRHELRCNGHAKPALVELHDIVHRESKQAGDVKPPPIKTPALPGSAVSGSGSPGPDTHPLGEGISANLK